MKRSSKRKARVEEAVDEHTAPAPGDRKYVTGADAQVPDRGVLRREQQDEAAESWAGPGLGPMTDAQTKGLVVGSLVGGLVGAIIFLPLGLISWGGLEIGWRLAVAALAGALAGGTGMALYLGGRQPELEGEARDVGDRPSIGTAPRDPHTDERGR
jgi:hypothetical protein